MNDGDILRLFVTLLDVFKNDTRCNPSPSNCSLVEKIMDDNSIVLIEDDKTARFLRTTMNGDKGPKLLVW